MTGKTTAQDGRWRSPGETFRSRLIVGTGKYRDNAAMVAAIRGVRRGDGHRGGAAR